MGKDEFSKELFRYAEMLMGIGVDMQTISESVCDLATTLGGTDLTIEYLGSMLDTRIPKAFILYYTFRGIPDQRLIAHPPKLA